MTSKHHFSQKLISIIVIICISASFLFGVAQFNVAHSASSTGTLKAALIILLENLLGLKGKSKADILKALADAGVDPALRDEILRELGYDTPDQIGTPPGESEVSDVKALIRSYYLPEPDLLVADAIRDKDLKTTWGTLELLKAEREMISKGVNVKRYLATAWIAAENGNHPDPYSVNCHNNKSESVRQSITELCPDEVRSDDIGKNMQVGGYQAVYKARQNLYKEVFGKLTDESELKSIMQGVVTNSANATNDNWDYTSKYGQGLVESYLGKNGEIPDSVSLDKIAGSESDFYDPEKQFYTTLLGKDSRMVIGLNSMGSGVTDGDLINGCLRQLYNDGKFDGPPCYGVGSYDNDWAQRLSNLIAGLWLYETGRDSLDPVEGGPVGSGDGTWPFFCQMWPGWKSRTSFNLASSGCGPTSISMIYCKLNGYDSSNKMSCPNLPPDQANKQLAAGGLTEGTGTLWGPTQNLIRGQLGLQMTPTLITKSVCSTSGKTNPANWGNVDLQMMKQHIDQGRVILASSCYFPCKGCRTEGSRISHVITIDEVDVAGRKVHIRDPNNCYSGSGEERPEKAWTDAYSFPWNVAWGVYK